MIPKRCPRCGSQSILREAVGVKNTSLRPEMRVIGYEYVCMMCGKVVYTKVINSPKKEGGVKWQKSRLRW